LVQSISENTPWPTFRDNFRSAIGDTMDGSEQLQQESNGCEWNANPAADDGVQCALIVGDYKEGVADSISVNTMADSLVIAHVCGASCGRARRIFKMSVHLT